MYNSDLPTRAELPSSKQLLRSTIIAIVVAGILLITVVLPSEYGIDPTRIGRLLGLTEMGEIKTQLAAEAKKDREADGCEPHLRKRPALKLLQLVRPTQQTTIKQMN